MTRRREEEPREPLAEGPIELDGRKVGNFTIVADPSPAEEAPAASSTPSPAAIPTGPAGPPPITMSPEQYLRAIAEARRAARPAPLDTAGDAPRSSIVGAVIGLVVIVGLVVGLVVLVRRILKGNEDILEAIEDLQA